ncbi:MAG TPA: membrane protein insertase YidC [Victivallales bacterium]|nr:membrane protein insertase YidC [Victivallales bacterium]
MFKNLDKTTIVVIVICVILLFSWDTIFGPKGLDLLPKKQTAQQTKVVKPETAKAATPSLKAPIEKSNTPKSEVANTNKQTSEKISNNNKSNTIDLAGLQKEYPLVSLTSPKSLMILHINPAKGSITSVTLKNIYDAAGKNKVVMDQNITPGALSVSQKNVKWTLEKVYPPITSNDKSQLTVKREFSTANGGSFLLTQNWKTAKDYTVDYSFTIKNLSSSSLNIRELNVWAGGIRPVHYLSGDVARSESHRIDVLLSQNSDLKSQKGDSSDFNEYQNQSIKWLALSDKYFACILKPLSNNGNFVGGNLNFRDQVKVTEKDGKTAKYYLIYSAGIIQNVNINGNQSNTWNFQYYVGTKDITLLKAFAPGATQIMHLAFMFLETIAQWLLYLLIFIKGYVGSYGWAIVVLTVLVKAVFWPITHKSNVSMKKMQKIQPMVKELREKYKDDKQKLNAKTMELYKKEKVNPLGGCLPILIQIPVFFALYWTLDGAIELRHAHFLWATNLAGPDTIGHLFGIHMLAINPWAILMALSMVAQQKLTPTATDPTQAKMMMLMPIVMLIFLYNLPSGLTMYWTISQVISVIQLLVNKYSDDDKKAEKKKQKKKLKTA